MRLTIGKSPSWILTASIAFIVLLSLQSYTEDTRSRIGNVVSDFSLPCVSGKNSSLSDYPDAKGFIIVFTCNHCPFAKLYPARLNALSTKYQSLHVPLLAISSTDTTLYEEDSFDRMKAKASAEHFTFPYLFDGDQQVARQFYAQKTPHAFVLWKEKGQWVVKYDGAIDDNGAEPTKVKASYVALAVDALLNGKSVAVKETKSIGCQIHFKK
jgi:peroxiredoxin